MKYILTLLIIIFLIGGCVRYVPASADINKPIDSRNIKPQEPEFKLCDQAVDYNLLLAAMPKQLQGYTASEPRGATLTFQDPSSQKTTKYSTASVHFTKKDSEWATDTIDVSIMDTCYLQFLSQTWLRFYELESTEGFVKRVAIKGYSGWHQYQKYDNSYSYTVLIKDRVMVSVKGKGEVTDSEVKNVIESIDFASIAAAAK